jgi:hypothetical protein
VLVIYSRHGPHIKHRYSVARSVVTLLCRLLCHNLVTALYSVVSQFNNREIWLTKLSCFGGNVNKKYLKANRWNNFWTEVLIGLLRISVLRKDNLKNKAIPVDSVVGWSTVLQAGKVCVRLSVRLLDFFNLRNPSSRIMDVGVNSASNRSEYQESSWG